MGDLGQFIATKGINCESEADPVPTIIHRATLFTCHTKFLKRIKDWLPVDYKNETIQLFKLAVPVFITEFLSILINFVSIAFCGHLGETELGAVGLATMIITVTGLSVGSGMSSACDTLISQTYGSGNLKHVGLVLQRGILVLLLTCFPCWALFINTEPFLLAVKQSPEVARLTQLYVNIFSPALPAAFMYHLQKKYLENQGIMWPQVIVGVIGNILNAIFNTILIYALDLGVVGSAVANGLSQLSLASILFIYIHWMGLHKATWSGWSLDCLQDWGQFTKVAIPSTVMICLQGWFFEMGGLLAALINEVELGAHLVVYQIAILVYTFPRGVGTATSVRVGNALGAGNTEQALASGKVSIICTLTFSSAVGILLALSKNVIGYVFTTKKEIVQRVAQVSILCGVFHPLDATAAVATRIMQGSGKQKIGAVCNLVVYYCVGTPLLLTLMFAAKMGIIGLWLGFIASVTLKAIAFITIMFKLNWKKVTEEAMVRAGVYVTEKTEVLEMENKRNALSAQRLYVVNTISSNVLSHENENLDLQELTLGRDETANAAIPQSLLVRQLLLRRGLTLLFMVLILTAGIITSTLLKHFM